MHPNHISAINNDVKEGLRRAGIGKAFHERSLSEFGAYGKTMVDLIMSGEVHRLVNTGKGMLLASEHPNSRDIFIMTARALFMGGISVKVVDPVFLVELRDDDLWEDLEGFVETGALFLTPFWEQGPSPFDRKQVSRLERMLKDRLDNKKPIFFHTYQNGGWPTTDKETTWYSKSFFSQAKLSIGASFPEMV